MLNINRSLVMTINIQGSDLQKFRIELTRNDFSENINKIIIPVTDIKVAMKSYFRYGSKVIPEKSKEKGNLCEDAIYASD